MEGRRISASPRPCSGRRILAKKRQRVDGFVNSVKKLQRREICSKRDRAFSMSNAQERFRNMRLMVCSFSFCILCYLAVLYCITYFSSLIAASFCLAIRCFFFSRKNSSPLHFCSSFAGYLLLCSFSSLTDFVGSVWPMPLSPFPISVHLDKMFLYVGCLRSGRRFIYG